MRLPRNPGPVLVQFVTANVIRTYEFVYNSTHPAPRFNIFIICYNACTLVICCNKNYYINVRFSDILSIFFFFFNCARPGQTRTDIFHKSE